VRQARSEARHRGEGFTLIELLIVIVILGVLAAIVLFAVGAFDKRGEQAACESDVKSVEVAVEAYKAREGEYPQTLGDLLDQPASYLRSVPNTQPDTGEYWITYDPATGQVGGVLEGGTICAGQVVTQVAGPTSTPTETPTGTATTTPSGGGGPGPSDTTVTTTVTVPGGGSSTSSSSSTNPNPSSSSSTSANPNPTPVAPVAAVNCFNPPPILDPWDCVASWSVPSGSPTGYGLQLVFRDGQSCSADDFDPWIFGWVLPDIDTTATSYTFEVLFSGNYCFRVRAKNGSIEGPWSPAVAFSWP
jgi:general secretion pathway protein G